MPNASNLQELQDRQALRELMVRYYRAVDRLDWEALKTVFTPDAHLNYNNGTFDGTGIEKIIEFIKPVGRSRVSMHFMAQQSATVHGDTATMETYATANGVRPREAGAPERHSGEALRYQDQLVRTPDGWRVKARVMLVVYTRLEASTVLA